jgi:hypothetical protein
MHFKKTGGLLIAALCILGVAALATPSYAASGPHASPQGVDEVCIYQPLDLLIASITDRDNKYHGPCGPHVVPAGTNPGFKKHQREEPPPCEKPPCEKPPCEWWWSTPE